MSFALDRNKYHQHTCRANIFFIVSGSVCGRAFTLEMTGILGVLMSVDANAASNLDTAGSIKLVWKAPATARRTCHREEKALLLGKRWCKKEKLRCKFHTVIRALKDFALASTASIPFMPPETA